MIPAVTPGWRARVTAVTLQPGTAMRRVEANSRLSVVQELGHAVGPGSGIVRAVEGLPCLPAGQAMVRTAVNEDGSVTADGSELFKGGRDGTGGAVRQGQEDDVMLRENLRLGRLDDPVNQ